MLRELAVTAENLETGTDQDLVEQLGTDVIPATKEVPHQSLQGSAHRLWSNALLDPDGKVRFPRWGLEFKSQARGGTHFIDGKVRFPHWGLEFKSQARGGTHFIAINQLANAGAIAMESTLQLARRISPKSNLGVNEAED
ncbi:hypothetical protein MMC31_001709 [Peltigera leucophlebia]|nr:hypothetical protein [Peltigera leucophlebia]